MNNLINGKDLKVIEDNLRAYNNNFDELVIVNSDFGKGYYVYRNKEDYINGYNYVQYCYSIDYLDGWLYGAVQAINNMLPVDKK